MTQRTVFLIWIIAAAIVGYPLTSSAQFRTGNNLESLMEKMADQLRAGISGTEVKRIGIAEFSPVTSDALKLGPYLSDKLTALLAPSGSVEVIERAQLDVILNEQILSGKDPVDQKIAQEVGKILGIQAFVIGSYTISEKEIEINARLVEVGTGKVFSASPVKIIKDKDIDSLLLPLVSPNHLHMEASLLAERRTERGMEYAAVPEKGTVYAKYNIKLFFHTNEDCYLYVIAFGPSGIAKVLFPQPKINFSNRVEGRKDYFISKGKGGIWLDGKTGHETIYLIAGYEPILDIDKMLAKIERAGHEEQIVVSKDLEKSLEKHLVASKNLEQSLAGNTVIGMNGNPSEEEKKPGSDSKKIELVSTVVMSGVKVVRKISFEYK